MSSQQTYISTCSLYAFYHVFSFTDFFLLQTTPCGHHPPLSVIAVRAFFSFLFFHSFQYHAYVECNSFRHITLTFWRHRVQVHRKRKQWDCLYHIRRNNYVLEGIARRLDFGRRKLVSQEGFCLCTCILSCLGGGTGDHRHTREGGAGNL